MPTRRSVAASNSKSKIFNLSQGKAPLIALTVAVAPALLKTAGSIIMGIEKFYFALGEELAHMALPAHRTGK